MNNFEIEAAKTEENKKERSVEQVFDSAVAKKSEYDLEIAADIENFASRQLLDKLIANFPSSLKNKMIEDAKVLIDRLAAGTMIVKDVNSDIEKMAKKAREGYIDGFGMLNHEYGKMLVMNEVDRALGGEGKTPDVLKSMAIINIDVNALKAVNELGGHAAGDQYLRLVVEVLKSGELTIFAEGRHLKIIPVHKSGDEFYLIVVGENGAKVEDADQEYLQSWVEKEVYRRRDAAELVNLEDDEVLYKLYSAERSSSGEPIEEPGAELFRRLRQEIPAGFEFRAAVATGAINLFDALAMDDRDKNSIKGEDDYEKHLAKMMGSLLDVSDDKMSERKKSGKAEQARSDDPRQKMLSRLYNFREAGIMKVKQEKEAAEKGLAREKERNSAGEKFQAELNSLNNEIISLLKVGAEKKAIEAKELKKTEIEEQLKKFREGK